MKKRFLLLVFCVGLMVLAGCQSENGKKTSDRNDPSAVEPGSGEKDEPDAGSILVEYLIYGGGVQTYEEACFGTVYQVTYDKKIRCYLECSDTDVAPEVIEVFTVDITEETYDALYKLVKKKDILSLDPKSEQDVCDGYSYYLRMYDENDELAGSVGGYMPTNRTMDKIAALILQDIPKEDAYQKIRDAKAPYLKYE